MASGRLTKTIVDGLAARETDYVHWCGVLKGFGCRVRTTGHKSFIAMYRAGGRNSAVRKVTIGTYGKVTVEQAREEAARVLAKAELGEDVALQRARIRAEITISQLCDEYMRDGVDHKKASTVASDRSRIGSHIRPLLGSKRIGAVTRSVIAQFLRDIAQGKTRRDVKTRKRGRSIVRGGKGTATRTVRLLGGIFTYAVRRDYLRENPCRGVLLFKDGKGERFLTEAEFSRLGDTLHLAESEGLPWRFNSGRNEKHRPVLPQNQREVIPRQVTAAIRLLMLTGCRLREILHLRWQDVDLDRGILNLTDSKTGQKKILVSRPVLEILVQLDRCGEFVISGRDPKKPRADLNRPWKRITSHAQLNGVRLHDLRHSYASVGAASGTGLVALGKLLGHASTTTTQRYAHLADDPLRRASDQIAALISTALSGGALSQHEKETSRIVQNLTADK